MPNNFLKLSEAGERGLDESGGKGVALSRMADAGLPVPETRVIPASAYHAFVRSAGLAETIRVEVTKASDPDARWEEIWEAALRVRNAFVRARVPDDLALSLEEGFEEVFGKADLAIRSSSPAEDAERASFAGLHDSYLDVGPAERLERVKMVWASLWNDRAMLYRRELGLDADKSAMAVVVQAMIPGQASGVVFSEAPGKPVEGVVEAVRDGNQEFVDGGKEPWRWMMDRDDGRILEEQPPTGNAPPPLSECQVRRVFRLAQEAEALFGAPQDVEWTLRDGDLYALQSRPVTTRAAPDASGWSGEDKRPWYLSLTRSFENLVELRRRVEEELLPAMHEEADRLAETDPGALGDSGLAVEIERRADVLDEYADRYWAECIPLAHAARLFGQVYNERLAPDDPFAFVDLLRGTEMRGVERNRLLERLAAVLAEDEEAARAARQGDPDALPREAERLLDEFAVSFGDLACFQGWCGGGREGVLRLALRLSGREKQPEKRKHGDPEELRRAYLNSFPPERREFGRRLLDLARAAYRLRDDDNLALGRLETRLDEAAGEGRERLAARGVERPEEITPREVASSLRDPGRSPERGKDSGKKSLGAKDGEFSGHAAGPGVAEGPARVVRSREELADFQLGEVLVCRSVDPSMTYVAPLAAAVVEERGGMLVHGAIIAREYGLPCVTGARGAVDALETGQRVLVDGYKGVVRKLDGK
ncbi:PEP/pyruvate-binding domain-containing protein [Desulfohalovibrio reitneri]|uniref:PEP/pyruvate-binding domain-containing protein n=1 Tax=Desulfohalovibrio reitneri TaxID=1307759 RepID=UPI0004A76A7A|nr:PEP/pyruvate-binding domain-containing protein [Desulfohalovibrio reitneri]